MEAGSDSKMSFLSLLLAPETTTDEDGIYQTTSQFYSKHLLPPPSSIIPPSTPPSFPPCNYDFYYQNSQHFLFPTPEPCFFPLPLPPSSSPEFSPAMPDLLSFENFVELHCNSPQPQLKPSPPPLQGKAARRDDYSLESILESYLESSKKKRKVVSSAAATKPEAAARRQRDRKQSKMSEKIYFLGKLLPGGHRYRMKTADMLEEAHKYVKFLQAQVNSLMSMPTQSLFTESQLGHGLGGGDSCSDEVGEELAKLSRQQLLEVVVNSPAAQVLMADKGWCLVAAEQMALLERIKARQKVIQQLIHNLPI